VDLFIVLVTFGLGLFFIIKGGDVLVKAAISLKNITGISSVIIGATFIAVATTLPEVFVSIFAVAAGNHGIAVGNAIGAMIANIALVLALSLLVFPNIVNRNEVFTKAIFLMLATVVVFLFSLNLRVQWYEGIILLAGFILFLLYNAKESKKTGRLCPEELNRPDGGISTAVIDCRGAWVKIIAGFFFGQIMLLAGAFALVENGEKLAHIFGISETVVGFTLIAVGTSLPELTTAIQSIRKKQGGLAVGNVIGANIINSTLLFGASAIIGDLQGESLPVSRETVFIAIPILMIMTAIAIVPLLVKGRTYRWQGAALLLTYAAYVTYLMIVQPV